MISDELVGLAYSHAIVCAADKLLRSEVFSGAPDEAVKAARDGVKKLAQSVEKLQGKAEDRAAIGQIQTLDGELKRIADSLDPPSDPLACIQAVAGLARHITGDDETAELVAEAMHPWKKKLFPQAAEKG